MNRSFKSSVAFFALVALLAPAAAWGQEKNQKPPDRAKILAAAREIIGAQTYCALATLDETGRPQVRTMNPFPPEEDMTVYFATSVKSRKAEQIRRDPRVCVYYADHSKAVGEVSLMGKAVLVDDPQEIKKRYREYWKMAFPDQKLLVLIKVMVDEVEVVNYKQGLYGDRLTFRAPSIKLGTEEPQK